MKKQSFMLGILFFIILGYSCGNNQKITRTDTPTSGIAQIAVDECFAPIVQEQIDVFEAQNEEAFIIPTYTNEAHAFELFMADSMRVIIAARDLTENEKLKIKEKNRQPRSQKYATDAIALIVNKANTDTLISVSDIRKIMTGQIRSWKELNPQSKLGDIAVAFDSPNSSTVRFIRDSICRDLPLGDNLRARSTDSTQTIDIKDRTPNQLVIDYVAANPNALGVIGVNWISNPNDPKHLSFIDNIKVMSVSKADTASIKDSYKPFAAYIALGEYPLSRDLYIVISDVRGGLPSGFVSFAAGEKGQRIVLKAGLFPAYQLTRVIRANQTLKD
ncbi:PstS family phosphate ABC transporter substrate-binding protein [Dysgonomonas sp. 511]|uniref:PstS family phosphate ABC transporter substrate-binding protein n=1 Tax=Dysgonomonas sp. 511 TaxID=2302930 RepID=UPI0013CF5119|nr:substrate-binding domain-containing protein [Dysgonomonas sp. 511]NDV78930.1 phosphate ABC transporter substrate-binding protein [Dysgonomonas sp. 511]